MTSQLLSKRGQHDASKQLLDYYPHIQQAWQGGNKLRFDSTIYRSISFEEVLKTSATDEYNQDSNPEGHIIL